MAVLSTLKGWFPNGFMGVPFTVGTSNWIGTTLSNCSPTTTVDKAGDGNANDAPIMAPCAKTAHRFQLGSMMMCLSEWIQVYAAVLSEL